MSRKPAKWSLRLWGTPVGPLFLTFTLKGLASLDFGEGGAYSPPVPEKESSLDLDMPPKQVAFFKSEALRTLGDYFSGTPPDFSTLPLDLQGTPFQLRVWQELREIPWGEIISYQELARRVGKPRATQAVGQAVGANPVALIIPCHRVIKADGSLGGYRGGLDRKRWLLEHEQLRGGPGERGSPALPSNSPPHSL